MAGEEESMGEASMRVWEYGSLDHFALHFQPVHFTRKSETKFKGQKKLRKLQESFYQTEKCGSGNHTGAEGFQMRSVYLAVDEFYAICF